MKRKYGIIVLLAALFLAMFAVSAQAECAHTTTVLKKVRAATCCVAGRYDRVCKDCGKVIKTNAYSPAATGKHAGIKAVLVKAPNCTTNGSVSIRCTTTNKQIGTGVVKAYGHSTTSKVLRAPTCTLTGSVQVSCTRCSFKTTCTINKLGHSMTGGCSMVSSTCTKKGYQVTHCSRCSYYTKAYFPLAEHKLCVASSTSTCTTNGKKIESCANCDYYKVLEVYPLADHKWAVSSNYASGAKYSYWSRDCQVCGLHEEGKTAMK